MNDEGELLIEQYKHNQAMIVEHLVGRRSPEPLLRHFVWAGVSKVMSDIRHKNRRLVKLGRADEIKFEKSRDDAVATVERNDEIDARSFGRLSNTLNNILKEYENSVLAKWRIAGVQLGNATPELLLQEADAEDRSAAGHTKNATFYRELARRGKPGQPLIMTISPDEADKLCASIFDEEHVA